MPTGSGGKRGGSALELTVLSALLVLTLVSTHGLFRIALQGRHKSQADQMGRQFSPALSTTKTTTTSYRKERTTRDPDGVRTITQVDDSYSQRESLDTFSNKPLTAEPLLQ
jgi:hypothetical protein